MVATYNSNREAAEAVADATGAVILPCQLGDPKSCQDFLAALGSRFDAIDLLVNNAGMAPRERRDILEATPESFDEFFATNLKGPYFMTQQIARGMLERKTRPHRLRRLDLELYRFRDSRRLLHDQGRHQHGREALCGAARSAQHPGV